MIQVPRVRIQGLVVNHIISRVFASNGREILSFCATSRKYTIVRSRAKVEGRLT